MKDLILGAMIIISLCVVLVATGKKVVVMHLECQEKL